MEYAPEFSGDYQTSSFYGKATSTAAVTPFSVNGEDWETKRLLQRMQREKLLQEAGLNSGPTLLGAQSEYSQPSSDLTVSSGPTFQPQLTPTTLSRPSSPPSISSTNNLTAPCRIAAIIDPQYGQAPPPPPQSEPSSYAYDLPSFRDQQPTTSSCPMPSAGLLALPSASDALAAILPPTTPLESGLYTVPPFIPTPINHYAEGGNLSPAKRVYPQHQWQASPPRNTEMGQYLLYPTEAQFQQDPIQARPASPTHSVVSVCTSEREFGASLGGKNAFASDRWRMTASPAKENVSPKVAYDFQDDQPVYGLASRVLARPPRSPGSGPGSRATSPERPIGGGLRRVFQEASNTSYHSSSLDRSRSMSPGRSPKDASLVLPGALIVDPETELKQRTSELRILPKKQLWEVSLRRDSDPNASACQEDSENGQAAAAPHHPSGSKLRRVPPPPPTSESNRADCASVISSSTGVTRKLFQGSVKPRLSAVPLDRTRSGALQRIYARQNEIDRRTRMDQLNSSFQK